VRAYDPLAGSIGTPGAEDVTQLAEHALQMRCLLLQERADMHARRGPIPSERHDVRDLGERQPEPTSLPYECEQT
jgi:hypothetical protein